MLVLSRKKAEQVSFPSLGVTITVLEIKGRTVRLGFEAPQSLSIARTELPKHSGVERPERVHLSRHDLRNRLNAAMLSLHLLSGSTDEELVASRDELARVLEELADLNQLVDGGKAKRHDANIDGLRSPRFSKRRSNANPRGRALVVDDSDNERELLAAYLHNQGFDVDQARDGIEALQRLESSKFDAILIDLRMPRMNGARTVHKIRQSKQLANVPVVGISGGKREDWHLPTTDRGLDRWFPKPVDPDMLVRQLVEITVSQRG